MHLSFEANSGLAFLPYELLNEINKDYSLFFDRKTDSTNPNEHINSDSLAFGFCRFKMPAQMTNPVGYLSSHFEPYIIVKPFFAHNRSLAPVKVEEFPNSGELTVNLQTGEIEGKIPVGTISFDPVSKKYRSNPSDINFHTISALILLHLSCTNLIPENVQFLRIPITNFNFTNQRILSFQGAYFSQNLGDEAQLALPYLMVSDVVDAVMENINLVFRKNQYFTNIATNYSLSIFLIAFNLVLILGILPITLAYLSQRREEIQNEATENLIDSIIS